MRWIKCQKSQCQEFSLFLARSNFNKTDVETKLQAEPTYKTQDTSNVGKPASRSRRPRFQPQLGDWLSKVFSLISSEKCRKNTSN